MAQKKINGYLISMKDVLGKGSYGSVYKGEQDGTKLECAVKVIQKNRILHDQYLKSALFSEIQILRMLKSQNIVKVWDVMESTNNYYIIQQICDSDLQKYLKVNRHIAQAHAINLLTQICNGFITLVREGIVHRDIKPANILMSKNIIKIGDFGFAKKNATKRIKNATTVGTPLYMPLQILKGESYTSKCDIWAVGFIFYEMTHGRTPWTANTEYQLITNIQTKKIVFNPNLHPLTISLIEGCLQLEQDKRFSWDQVFTHPIFGGYFNQYALQNKQFQDKLKRVMGQLRFEINSKNIDLNRLLDGLGFKKHTELNYQQFSEFIRHIHPKISKDEISFFFQKMDINSDGSISLSELSSAMEKHRIVFNKIAQQKPQTFIPKFTSNGEYPNIKLSQELQSKVKRCFAKLYKILTGRNLTLYKTFHAYDTDNNGELGINQFEKIMQRLDTALTEDEIKTIFQIIDTDRSKTIQFDQLNSYYCKVNGLAEGLTLPQEYYKNKINKQY